MAIQARDTKHHDRLRPLLSWFHVDPIFLLALLLSMRPDVLPDPILPSFLSFSLVSAPPPYYLSPYSTKKPIMSLFWSSLDLDHWG